MARSSSQPARSGGETPLWAGVRLALGVALVAPVVLHFGWPDADRPLAHVSLWWLQAALVPLYIAALALPLLPAPRSERFALALRDKFEWTVSLAALAAVWNWEVLSILSCVLLGLALLNVYILLIQSRVPNGLLFVGSFAGLTLLGAFALTLPNATPPDAPISFIDALFTSTSAVCVTGLVVRDTCNEFTRLGQSIILTLIQLGGLGIITFGAVLSVAFGGAIGLRGSRTIAETAGETIGTPQGIKRLAGFIAGSTFLIEALGAGALYYGWPQGWSNAADMTDPGDRLFHCVFVSVSAFCNAGFMTTPDNLEQLRFHWTSHLVVAPLIVLGGIGFPVLANLVSWLAARLRGRRLVRGALVRPNLHTRLVLLMTLVIYLFGLALLFADRVLFGGQAVWAAALDAHFASITTRTAGFNTIPCDDFSAMGRLVMMIQMFIGGSPGGTAGGVKTVVVAVLALAVWNTLTGAPHAHAFKRNLPEALFRKAATLITLQVATVAVITGMLTVSEHHAAFMPTTEALVFEAISATSTVGLSMNLTSGLSDPGRIVVALAMFVGRVGPLALLASIVIVARRKRGAYEYPTEGVVMS